VTGRWGECGLSVWLPIPRTIPSMNWRFVRHTSASACRATRCEGQLRTPRLPFSTALLKCGLNGDVAYSSSRSSLACLVSRRTRTAQSTSASSGPGLRHELTGSSERRMVSPACSTS
jgi:hypothetical protein